MFIDLKTDRGVLSVPAIDIKGIFSENPNAKTCMAVTPLGEIPILNESLPELRERINQTIINFQAEATAAAQKKIMGDDHGAA